jgi:hypothetical protein
VALRNSLCREGQYVARKKVVHSNFADDDDEYWLVMSDLVL